MSTPALTRPRAPVAIGPPTRAPTPTRTPAPAPEPTRAPVWPFPRAILPTRPGAPLFNPDNFEEAPL